MMKKELKRALLCVLAALMALLALSACGEQPAPPEEEENNDPKPGIHAPVEETAPVDPEETDEPETPPPAAGAEEPLTLSDALYGAGEFNAPTPVSYNTMDPTLSQDERIGQIREWFYELDPGIDEKGDRYEKRVYDNSFTAYWDGGKLVKIQVVEALDPTVPDGTKYNYYYKDGNPYFIYIEDSAHQLRLYYWNAEMIRWIETDGVPHDSSNPAYGQYFATSWRLYQVVTELG